MIFKYNSTHTEFKIFLKFSWFILYSKKEKKKILDFRSFNRRETIILHSCAITVPCARIRYANARGMGHVA